MSNSINDSKHQARFVHVNVSKYPMHRRFLVTMRYCVRASYHQLSDSKRYRVRACFKFGFTHHCCYNPQNSDVFSHLDEFPFPATISFLVLVWYCVRACVLNFQKLHKTYAPNFGNLANMWKRWPHSNY